MKKEVLLFVLLCFVLGAYGQHAALMEQLDSVLDNRSAIIKEKYNRIAYLTGHIAKEDNASRRLQLLAGIYQEYYVFQHDSAMCYTQRMFKLASAVDNSYYKQLALMNEAYLLSIDGLYAESLTCMERVDTLSLDSSLRSQYYLTLFRIYSYWAAYDNDSKYAPKYRSLAKNYVAMAIPYLKPDYDGYDYYLGEYDVLAKDYAGAQKHFMATLGKVPKSSRFYAMACYSLAHLTNSRKITDKNVDYLIMSAISDVLGCTMENMALKQLALYIYNHDDTGKNIKRAMQYMNTSLNDAKFYNSQLRIMQASQEMTPIFSNYNRLLDERMHVQQLVSMAFLVISLLLTAAIGFIFRQNSRLNQQRKLLKQANERLEKSNERETFLNKKLSNLNERLIRTNNRRENLAKLYIDICARYIDKFTKYKTLVKRKVKAHQEKDLLKTSASEKYSQEEEAFLFRFDQVFLEMYPNFISELNSLLKDDCKLAAPRKNTLTMELRICALIRMGVTESYEIAGLLFYSPQTIYNYRTTLRNMAKNRETFCEDIQRLSKEA